MGKSKFLPSQDELYAQFDREKHTADQSLKHQDQSLQHDIKIRLVTVKCFIHNNP